MNRHLQLFAALSIVFATSTSQAQDKVETAPAIEQAKVAVKAVVTGDYAKLVDSTHPKVIEMMGGREKMIAATKAAMDGLKSTGITIQSHDLGKAQDPVIDGKTAYIIIPTKMVLKTEDGKIKTESYLLGMSTDGGKKWVFVDGAGMDQPKVKELVFPKLPEGLKLPEKKEPTVEKD